MIQLNQGAKGYLLAEISRKPQMHIQKINKPVLFKIIPIVTLIGTVCYTAVGHAALTATTQRTIQGTAPYLTYDGGTTKVTTTAGLLGIKLSDGSTPAPNSSTTPITLPAAGETFADIEMLVPAITPPASASNPTQTISWTDAIGAPNNYWGDDDDDGLGTSGITATGSLSVVITDKYGTKVNRSDIATVCGAPYKVVLSSTAGSLSTQYGDPSSSAFTAANATYYINPVAIPTVCFAKPDMNHAAWKYAGPESVWNTTMGFIPQSTTPDTYGSNFPTTGANGLYFELEIAGVTSALDWTTVSASGVTGDITATPSACATPSINCIKYTLTGPEPTAAQMTAVNPGVLTPTPTLPATLELEGQSGGTTVVKYGFTVKQWHVNQKKGLATAAAASTWCTGLGYRLPKLAELTNAEGTALGSGGTIPVTGTVTGSGGNYSNRTIGTGLFAEWGYLTDAYYPGSGFNGSRYWVSELESTNTFQFLVSAFDGTVSSMTPNSVGHIICTRS